MASHGGRREGAGRPRGSGRYQGEPTRVVRIPASLVDSTVAQLKTYAGSRRTPTRALARAGLAKFKMKLATEGSEDSRYEEETNCDLHALLVDNPSSTFVYTVTDDAMDRAGIVRGDRVLVDRAMEPTNGDIVLAVLGTRETMIKRLLENRRGVSLFPESTNAEHRSYPLQPDRGDAVWGVVIGVVRRITKAKE